MIHAQYMATSDEAKKNGANDYLISYLIDIFREKKYFILGRSTDDNFKYNINDGLFKSKEEFGSENHVFETYSLNL